jgi:hypothetical protein
MAPPRGHVDVLLSAPSAAADGYMTEGDDPPEFTGSKPTGPPPTTRWPEGSADARRILGEGPPRLPSQSLVARQTGL